MKRANINDFKNSQINDINVVNDIIANSYLCSSKNGYRIIKHSEDTELKPGDFYPTFLTKSLYTNKKVEKEYYGLSLLSSYEQCLNYIETFSAFRNKTCCVASGFTSEKKGTIGIEKKSHFQYYLFDPKEKNPYVDFKYYK